MTNEITKHGGKQLPAERKARGTREEVAMALAPMFALFPHINIGEATVAAYVEHLIDIPLDSLKDAIKVATQTAEFLPTVAHIRKAYQATSEPGPRNDLNEAQIAARPAWWEGAQLYRESDAERMERLRRTEKWSARYGH